MTGEMLAALLLTVMLLAFFAVAWMALQSQRRVRELEHRERLAMIERGLVPPPELDPLLFEHTTGLGARPGLLAGERSRSFGVILIGIGLGLIILLSFAAGSPDIGVGIGGAVAVLGAAFYVNGMLASRRDPALDRRSPPRQPRGEPGRGTPTDPA